jgi:hypothetical protein
MSVDLLIQVVIFVLGVVALVGARRNRGRLSPIEHRQALFSLARVWWF